MHIQRLHNFQLQIPNCVLCTDFDGRPAFACPLAFPIAYTTSAACVQACFVTQTQRQPGNPETTSTLLNL